MTILSLVARFLPAITGDPRDAIARVIRANPQLQEQVEEAVRFLGSGHLAIIANHLPNDETTRNLLIKHNLSFTALADTTDASSPRIQLLLFLRYFASEDYQIPADKGMLSELLQQKYMIFKESVIKRVLSARNDPDAKAIPKQLFQPIFAELDQGFYLISNLITKLADLEILQRTRNKQTGN